MTKTARSALVCAMLATPGAAMAQDMPAPTGKTFTLVDEIRAGYHNTQRDLTEAAEKMPEADYAFKPTPEIRPFGQLVAHVALSQFRTCAMLKDEPSPRKDEKEEATRTKGEAIALLKASKAYCDPLVDGLTEPAMIDLAKSGQNKVARGLLPVSLVAHGLETYGTMAVYLRLKGIVPPSTERMNQEMKKKGEIKKSE